MRQPFRCRRGIIVAAWLALLVFGCGPGGVKVEGKVLNNGQPYAPPEGAKLSLSLSGGESGKSAAVGAAVNSDGSFMIDRVPPGKYKVTLSLSPETTDPGSLDKFKQSNDAFTPVNGKECEITSEAGKPLVIDIAKGTVTR